MAFVSLIYIWSVYCMVSWLDGNITEVLELPWDTDRKGQGAFVAASVEYLHMCVVYKVGYQFPSARVLSIVFAVTFIYHKTVQFFNEVYGRAIAKVNA